MTVESEKESNNSEWNTGASLGVGSWQLGASFDRLTSKLHSRVVSNITLHRDSFGNSSVDHITMQLRTLEEVDFQQNGIFV
jgi:hypothetical protein